MFLYKGKNILPVNIKTLLLLLNLCEYFAYLSAGGYKDIRKVWILVKRI